LVRLSLSLLVAVVLLQVLQQGAVGLIQALSLVPQLPLLAEAEAAVVMRLLLEMDCLAVLGVAEV
jgi:hypothetical protein